ncbi:MAG: methyl-accepting chemotaxis protein [Gammaproteobacteria bacterium]|nr:methyl-accepting chemotaxis protein [Gammaproteobacteria bacterium]
MLYKKITSIKQKILLTVGGSTALLLGLAAIIGVNHIANQTEAQVQAQVNSLMRKEAVSVGQFFAEYAQVAKTFLHNPQFQEWFKNYPGRGTELNGLAGYEHINNTFKTISGQDKNILSAFFALDRSAEYFREDSRTGVDIEGPDAGKVDKGYFATQRPWYLESVKHDKFFVGSPSADFTTGIVSAVVESTVYAPDGKLLGVGGLDLHINKVGDKVDAITYEGQGIPFLLDSLGQVVHFSNKSGVEIKANDKLEEFSQKFADTEGFGAIAEAARRSQSGFMPITFRGKAYYAAFEPIQRDFPEMQWLVGILVPAELIDGPIQSAIGWASALTVIILIVVVLSILISSTLITRPLIDLTHAMKDIASGEGDLTKTINIDQNDEVGALAKHFNTFISKLRKSLENTRQQAIQVQSSSHHLNQVVTLTNQEIQHEKAQIDSVSAAVTEMSVTVQEISRNAKETSGAADDAQRRGQQGFLLSEQAVNDMNLLDRSMVEAVDVVMGLAKESESIGTVVDVIKGIAEQTNLLALNAAIEAARAGEQGRGFAVVADEVRSLAGRTRESTDDIRRMVEKLQQIAKNAEEVMQRGRSQTEVSAGRAQSMQQALRGISDAIVVVQQQSTQIAVATEQQTIVADDINRSLHSITQLVDNTASHAEELYGEARQLDSSATELNQVVGQFKI